MCCCSCWWRKRPASPSTARCATRFSLRWAWRTVGSGGDDSFAEQAAVPYGSDGEALPTYRFTGTSGAGLYSTVEDMTKFVTAGLPSDDAATGRGVLSRDAAERMQRRVRLTDDSEGRCGLGYFLAPKTDALPLRISHSGSNAGWRALFVAAPELGDGIVMLANGNDGAEKAFNRLVCLWGESELGLRMPHCGRAGG